ncbi:MAG TPA: DUF1893 domain-containing protein [Dehalococcoidales bacterium]|nr:DUF1893 domain-containing protein [Dehalococcoidales bacterium]
MSKDFYKAFISSDDTLRIYDGETLAFSSKKDQLLPLMEYIAAQKAAGGPVTIYDKVIGNSAALLAVKANAREACSPLGSEIAVKTLQKYGVKYHLDKIVPRIKRPDGRGLCPMEEMSIGKDPEEFYRELKARIEANK